MSDGNGGERQTWKQRLEIMGAPDWFMASETRRDTLHLEMCGQVKRLSDRVSSLEQLAVGHAASEGKKAGGKSGAAAGRRWGAIVGIFLATVISTGLSQCNPLNHQNTEVKK